MADQQIQIPVGGTPMAAAAPAPTAEPPSASAEADARMEKMMQVEPTKPAEPKPAKEAPKEQPKVEPKAEQPREPVKVEPAKEQPKVEAPKEPAKQRPWEMYRNEKKSKEEALSQIAQLKKELETVRSQKPEFDPTKHPEFVKYKTRAEELENEIRFTNYEKSNEFKDKYLEPYTKLANELTKEATELVVETTDEATGQTNGRALTAAEFWNVVRAPKTEDAHKLAKSLFPNDPVKVTEILRMRKDIARSYQSMEGARQEYRQKGAEREAQLLAEQKQKQELSQAQQVKQSEQFQQFIELGLKNEKFKDFFIPADEDAKGKEILTKGMKLADQAFGLYEDGEQELTGEEQLAMHAAIRNRAGSWPYVVHKYRQLAGEMAELKTKLAQYEQSEPGDGKPKAEAEVKPDSALSWEERLEKQAVSQLAGVS